MFKKLSLGNAAEYRLDENSVFFDLGSGFGKPCMHMSYKVGCRSYGLEMENVRHQACIEALLLLS